jgi:hypothetical protein
LSFSYSGYSAWFEDMRLIIVAGLLMGVSLGIQSAHSVHASAKVGRATSAGRVLVGAPWYIAMNAGRCAALPRSAFEKLILVASS